MVVNFDVNRKYTLNNKKLESEERDWRRDEKRIRHVDSRSENHPLPLILFLSLALQNKPKPLFLNLSLTLLLLLLFNSN